ncbi:MAG TPA: transposase [Methylomirabilota bacterium]|nr:transposase [Methylomirabilota bacterium]
MPNKLVRHYGRGHLHFITFSCYRRLPFLRSVRAKNTFVRILDEVRERYGFSLVGYVVMPEHVHLLLSEPKQGTPSTVMQVLKQRVSRRLRSPGPRKRRKSPPFAVQKMGHPPQQLRLRFGDEDAPLRQFWQRRFHDFNVWSARKRREKLEYMQANPVKRKLVAHPKEWEWSSFSFYSSLKRGLIRVDPVH